MTPAQRHMQRVSALGCCVCRRLGHGETPAQVHHVAEGSSKRSPFAVAPLCPEHHQGKTGLHGMGAKAFAIRYGVPWDREEGLLVWVNEDLARAA